MEGERVLKNSVDLPHIIVDHKKYKLTDMIDRELSDLKIQLEISLSEINRSIAEVKLGFRATGKSAKPTWFSSVTRLRGVRSAQIRCIDAELSERKKRRIKAEDRSMEYWFMQAAKAMLHQEGFRSIMEAARAMREGAEG